MYYYNTATLSQVPAHARARTCCVCVNAYDGLGLELLLVTAYATLQLDSTWKPKASAFGLPTVSLPLRFCQALAQAQRLFHAPIMPQGVLLYCGMNR